MCLKRLTRVLSLVLCLLVFLQGPCMASSVTLSDQQKTQLMQNFDTFDRKLEIFGQNLDKSVRELLTAEEKLAKQDERLARQETLLLRYENVVKTIEEKSKALEDSFEKANKLLQEERKAHQNELRKKEAKAVMYGIGGILIGVAISKLSGK